MRVAQHTLPFAVVQGKPVDALPDDLFIPPEALEVFLEAFEGPLDLLLYLIRKQKFDIVALPILPITEQYLEYIGMLQGAKVELAADYLVMAATLAEIKSRLLLPKADSDSDEEVDPRTQLIRQLQAYEVIKNAQARLDQLPRMERDHFQAHASARADIERIVMPADVSLAELAQAFAAVLERVEAYEHHHVQREQLSTRERMSAILAQLSHDSYCLFEELFPDSEGRSGVVVTFLALMELIKEGLIEVRQAEPFSAIYVKAS